MWNQAFQRLCRRLEDEPPVFFAEEIAEFPPEITEWLSARGLLRRTTPSLSATCQDCGRAAMARVELLRSSRTGRTHAYLPCSCCGVVEIPLERLNRWVVDAAAMVQELAGAAGLQGKVREVVTGRLWWAGKFCRAGRRREAYFARHVHEVCRESVSAELARRPGALVFVPTDEAVERRADGGTNPVFALETVLTLGEREWAFDTLLVDARLGDAGRLKMPAGKPPRKRAGRAGKIEALVGELVEHLRAARDHAYTTSDTLGTAKLLPRPSQQDLAKRTGLTESDVSRCLKDPAARELRLLWQTALELDAVLGWKGRPHR